MEIGSSSSGGAGCRTASGSIVTRRQIAGGAVPGWTGGSVETCMRADANTASSCGREEQAAVRTWDAGFAGAPGADAEAVQGHAGCWGGGVHG